MAFSEFEVKRIDKLVGGFCRRRTRPELADQLRIDYAVEGQSVIILEERPDWRAHQLATNRKERARGQDTARQNPRFDRVTRCATRSS